MKEEACIQGTVSKAPSYSLSVCMLLLCALSYCSLLGGKPYVLLCQGPDFCVFTLKLSKTQCVCFPLCVGMWLWKWSVEKHLLIYISRSRFSSAVGMY